MFNKLNIILLVVILNSFGIVYFLIKGENEKTAFVDINKVYSEFEMKKMLEAKLDNIQQARKRILDSLGMELKDLSLKSKLDKSLSQSFEVKKEIFFSKRKEFEEDNQALSEKYNEQVLKQMNQYIQDFGKQEGYTYVFGANGSGALMYANEKNDVTEKVIKYIDIKYKGINGKE